MKPESGKKDRMKYLFADALKVCMKTAPLEKITVKEIVDQCGTTRQTFYRHFQDKQEDFRKHLYAPIRI